LYKRRRSLSANTLRRADKPGNSDLPQMGQGKP
jgi:hypothetical protein